LQSQYDAGDRNINPNPWEFKDGHSASVCVEGLGFYEANTSDLRQPFDDAFVSFHNPMQISSGAGAVAYLPQNWFDTGTTNHRARFSQICFENFINAGGAPPLDKRHNDFHLIGASRMQNKVGVSDADYDFVYSLIGEMEADPSCQPFLNICFKDNAAHEISHLFRTNQCTNLIECGNPGNFLGKHDYREWWFYGGVVCPPPANPHPCLMNPSMQINEVDRFCKEDLLLGDPNCPAGDPKDGAIRTNEDPE